MIVLHLHVYDSTFWPHTSTSREPIMATPQRPILLLIAFLLACFALAACTPSAMAGGLTGGTIGMFLLGMLLVGGLTTQAACTDEEPTTPEDMGQDLNVSACLSLPLEDMGKDMDVGPCLSIAPDLGDDMSEDMDRDMDVGPCLSPLPPDMSKDMDVGPCLSPPLEDMGGEEMGALTPATPDATPAPIDDRQQLLAKLADRLPADVVARLDDTHHS